MRQRIASGGASGRAMVRSLGVVLAGGKGRRLQIGAPKALARVAGVTLLERAVGTLRAICDEVVTVAPEELALPIPAGSRRVHDSGRGPLEALVAGLEAAPYQRALVLGVDFPLISPATLTAIAERLGGAVAAVPRPGAWLQPLVAAYAPSAAAALAAAIAHGERALLVAVEEIGPRVIEPDEVAALPGGIEGFLNLNGPEDLAEAERRLDPMVRG